MSFHALIASGDQSLVERFSAALSEVGIRVESAPETGCALSLLYSQHFDAVILDCDLSDSITMLDTIRDEPTTQKVLVIALASNNDVMKSASRLGANFSLSKPINWDVAKRTLRAALTLIIRERRTSIRERVRVPARLMFGKKMVEVTIFDLSDGGLAVRIPVLLTKGMPVDVHLTLPGSRNDIHCNGIVAWATEELAGIEFTYLAPSSAHVIVRWLDSHSPRRGQITKHFLPAKQARNSGF
jgi:ActR/RegA family two-component response regulator